MDKKRALDLKEKVFTYWEKTLYGKSFESVLVNCGKDYLPALESVELPVHTIFCAGAIGIRGRQLKKWLNENNGI